MRSKRRWRRELDYIVIKSRLYSMAEGDMSPAPNAGALMKDNPNARVLMGDDPRLPAMPEKPTLMDFFKYRFGPCMHLLQSARHAVKADLPEKMVLACLLHDISTIGFIRGDHGYWGAQLVEPYVDEEVTWAIRAHQVLRFYPDESVGYEYPQSYITSFGQEYRPDPYIEEDYKRMRNHKWYMSGRQITVHDIYSFDPNVHVELEEFTDIIGRNFRQPEAGARLRQQPGRAYVAGDDPPGEVPVNSHREISLVLVWCPTSCLHKSPSSRRARASPAIPEAMDTGLREIAKSRCPWTAAPSADHPGVVPNASVCV